MMKKIGIAVAVVTLLTGSGYGLYRYHYPFGMCHRCNKLLFMALDEYARAHGGEFPTGQATPEASLSLISTLEEYRGCAYLLRRRDVAEEVAQELLDGGQLLSPETCGWNYVEGLRSDSNPRLALFWDKEGLDEMGGRLPGGGHFVTFTQCRMETIPASDWDNFLKEQRRLLAEEKAKTR